MTRQDYRIYLLFKEFNAEKAHDFLIECRKKDRLNTPSKQNHTIICYDIDCGDAWIEKIVYPYEFTAEEIEEYTEENWMYIRSMYDCTGRTFTRDIRCFPICGKTIVYHFKAIDC